MANGHTAVYCRLPHGLVLRHPLDAEKTFEIKGQNKATIKGTGYGVTMVPDEFWEQWEAVNKDFPAVKSGAIFTADSNKDGEAIVKEFAGRKTGFEGMAQDAMGVQKATEKDED